MKRALLINWDNYPNVATGGVYVWEKSFVEGMKDWDFIVFNQLSNSNANANYKLPSNVKNVIELPLFGTNRIEEYQKEDTSLFSKIFRTSDDVIEDEFVPRFELFLKSVLADHFNSEQIQTSIQELHRFLIVHDSKKCFELHSVWDTFLKFLCRDPLYKQMPLKQALTAFQLLQRGLQVLSVQIPSVDLVHCSLAWMPSMVAICAKKEQNVPVIVTEHGVALRELLLYYNAYLYNESSKIFWKVFSGNVVRAIYSIADAIVPVCKTNAIWEKSLGAEPEKLNVIYNGVDLQKFRPLQVNRMSNRPTVVSVARVDVFKDIVALIQSIDYVRQTIPDVLCLLYGGSIDLDYSRKCVKTVEDLDLKENFKFMGRTKEPEKAYNSGDVVVFSSITEGFPFAVIEAMACGKAIVASDVGGVREALEGCGILARSRRPKELADGVVRLLEDKELRSQLGSEALKKARDNFSIEKSINDYRWLYATIGSTAKDRQTVEAREVIVSS